MKQFRSGLYLLLLFSLALVVSCSDDEPTPDAGEDGEEEITRVELTFTPDNGEDAVSAVWFDEDGEGTSAPTIDEIELEEDVTYTMTVTLTNTLGTEDEDITAEIQEEDDEHQFFFGFTDGIFSNPTGDGNIDNRDDAVNYNDQDGNGLPVGLSTTWTTGEHGEGEFRIVLKHQPDLKSATSDFSTGGTDIDITFELHIEEDGHGHDDGEEEINEVVLTFTPDNGEDAITAKWFDEDGEGVGAPTIDEIELEEGVTYEMTVTLTNTLGMDPEDITAEILEEDNEHQFFFAFSEGYFSSPEGDGNIDNRDDPLNYSDEDENGLPVGLTTSWTAGDHSEDEGEFRIILKHQPDLKSATSDAETGGTDIDITFPLHIEEEGHSHDDGEEEINEVTLTFTPTGGGDAIEVKWFDEDGEGVGAPVIDDITLSPETEYDMTITLTNTLGTDPEDITAEIEEEDDEHMFFFAFTADIFSDPAGDGNIDNRDDALNYNDQDDNGNPVGLSTKWTTGAATSSDGTFRVVLKHQPDIKSATSTSEDGGTDIDIEFNISIE